MTIKKINLLKNSYLGLKRVCDCGESYQANYIDNGLCPKCNDAKVREYDQSLIREKIKEREDQKKLLIRNIPYNFQETDIKHKNFPITKYRQILNVDLRKKGIYIFGESGKCKSRILWKLWENDILNYSKNKFLKRGQILSNWERRFFKDPENFYKSCEKAKILFWDDFGKEKLSESFANVIFRIIDERYSYKRFNIITSQFSPLQIIKRCDDLENGKATIRRLIEQMEVIEL